ncbi:MAG: ABC transporter permease [Polyangiales bacterium]
MSTHASVPQQPAASVRPPASRLRRSRSLLGPLVALLVLFGLFVWVVPGQFSSAYNLRTIAAQTVIVGLGAIGMTFVIVSGGIDLSVGSVIALASVVTALCLRNGVPVGIALLAGTGSGVLVGSVNGLLVTRLGIVPFIVTLGSMGVARGLAKYLADEQKIDAPAAGLAELMAKTPEPRWLLVAPGVWLLLGLALVAGFVLSRTVFGVHVSAVGSSEPTARLCGVRVERVKHAVYVLSGLCAALAGTLQFARLTVGDPTTALGKELDIIAAVVIGGGSLAGGSGSIVGSLLGAFLMTVLGNGCTLLGLGNSVGGGGGGAIIVLAVALDRWRRNRRDAS